MSVISKIAEVKRLQNSGSMPLSMGRVVAGVAPGRRQKKLKFLVVVIDKSMRTIRGEGGWVCPGDRGFYEGNGYKSGMRRR